MTTCLRAPSVKTLQARLSLSREGANHLRKLLVRWREAPANERDDAADAVLTQADDYLNGYGVETIRNPDDWDSYYGDCIALYANAGDTYTPTVLYDPRDESWWVGSWGDWYERYESGQGD